MEGKSNTRQPCAFLCPQCSLHNFNFYHCNFLCNLITIPCIIELTPPHSPTFIGAYLSLSGLITSAIAPPTGRLRQHQQSSDNDNKLKTWYELPSRRGLTRLAQHGLWLTKPLPQYPQSWVGESAARSHQRVSYYTVANLLFESLIINLIPAFLPARF